jgi:hypothetical protein
MKKFFTLLLSSLFSLSLLAFDGSRLSISVPSTSSELKVEIDGRPFTMKNNSITVGYLGEGRHDVKIYKEAKRTRGNFGRREIVYNKSVILKKGFHLDITVNRFGKVLVDERRIDHEDEWYNDEDEYYDHEGWDNSMNKMSVREFEQLKESLRKEWFENNRLISVKTIIEKSNFSAQQVKDLMLLFTFENNRLEIAKAAYRKTIDKENYYLLNEALTFSSSKEQLARFIRESR